MANREIYPSALFPNRGDLSAEAGATTTTVVGIQTVPVTPVLPTDSQILVDINGVWTPKSINASITVNQVPVSDDYEIGVNLPLFGNGGPVSINGA